MFIWIVLMAASLIGILWCAKVQKQNRNAQTYAICCLVGVLIAAFGILNHYGMFGGTSSEIKRIIQNEKKYSEAKAYVMARYLAEKFPNASAVILTDSYTEQSEAMRNAVEVFKNNLGSINVISTETIVIPEPDPENPMPMEEMVTSKQFNEIFDKSKGANLIINFASFPPNPEEIMNFSIWRMPNGPKLVLYNGEIGLLKNTIKQGFVVAATALNGNAIDPQKKAPSDNQEAFDSRFVLITPENVDQVAEQNKNIFIPPM